MPDKSNKPKFCHDCAVPIERAKQTILTNRYYCELCETEHTLNFLLLRVGIGLCILFGIVGVGALLQKPEKPLNLVSRNFTGNSTNINNNAREQNSNTGSVQIASKTQNVNSAAALLPEKPAIARASQDLGAKKIENQQPGALEETTYFCGAPTKKGTPCSRRVKGGGRCWQHVGKSAMLPPEKLVASR